MKNFRSIVLNNTSSKQTLQELYSALMRRPQERPAQSLIFTTLNKIQFTDQEPLLSCIRSSQIPIKNVKSVSVRMNFVYRSNWAALEVLCKGGVLVDKVEVIQDTDYSPLIIDIIQRGGSFR